MKNPQMPEPPTSLPNVLPPPPPPGGDISKAVTSIARQIDRLPSGHYVVEIEKPTHLSGEDWQVKIDRIEKVREMDITVNRRGAVAPAQIIGNHAGRLQPKRGTR